MKNVGREFATMSEDERRRYLIEQGESPDEPQELSFDDPRDSDRMGRTYASPKDEVADPDSRDGTSAQLDDAAHEESVRRQSLGTDPE